ncbi:MAG: hypothetical protein ACRELB_07520 [Polyangiaceae bacterium]
MRTRSFLALAVAALTAVSASPLLAAGPARPQPRWALSWQAALQEAKERNVPIYIAYHQDG